MQLLFILIDSRRSVRGLQFFLLLLCNRWRRPGLGEKWMEKMNSALQEVNSSCIGTSSDTEEVGWLAGLCR